MSSRIPTGIDFYNGHGNPLTPMDLVTQSQSAKVKIAPRHEPPTPKKQITGVEFISAANQRDFTMRPLPCVDNLTKVFRRFRPKMRSAGTAPTGIARNQPFGLASQPQKYPTNLPIMSHPDTFYPAMNSTISAPA